MNFTQIEIIGFKSFADKTLIHFDHGVTGIVGPNGSGKSNVADAIRWVLGEQSAKTMRGSTMQDVIFGGSKQRKAMSYCEVSLFFDNTNGLFKSDPRTQIVLTRKLFRSGESSYLINGEECRMKDIVDLLHECSLSKQGYSIIGQNKVSDIINSKPVDRRTIFEEAIGIAKTREQRLEAQRKLQRANDNIARFSDICHNLEVQLAPLEIQKKKAEEYNEYSAALKMHEINAYLYKKMNQGIARQAIEQRADQFRAQLDSKRKDYEAADELYTKSEENAGHIDADLKQMNDTLVALTEKYGRKIGEAGKITQQIEFLEQKAERMTAENEQSQQNLEKDRVALADKNSAISKNEKEVETLTSRTAKLSEQIISMGNELAEWDAQTNKYINAINDKWSKKADIATLKGELKSLQAQKAEKAAKEKGIIAKKTSLEAEKVVNEEEITRINNENSSLTDELAASENGLAVTKSKKLEAEKTLDTLNRFIAQTEANIATYENLKSSNGAYQEAVRTLLNDAKQDRKLAQKIKGTLVSLINVDKEYGLAITVALGGNAQNIVTDNDNDASDLIAYLKANEIPPITFLPINTVKYREDSKTVLDAVRERGAIDVATRLVKYDKYYEPVIRFILGNTLVCDNLDNAKLIARKYGYAFRIVTLEGDVLTAQGTMTGGSMKRRAGGVLMIDAAIEDFKKKYAELNSQKEELERKIARHQATINSLEAEIASMHEKQYGFKETLSVLKEKTSKCTQDIAAAEEEYVAWRKDLADVTATLNLLAKRISDTESGAVEENEGSRDGKEEYYANLRKEREKIFAENTECQSRLGSLKSQLKADKDEVQRLTDEIANLRKSIASNDANIKSNREIVDKIKEESERTLYTDEERKRINELRENIRTLETTKETLRTTISTANQDKERLNTEILDLTTALNKEEFNLQKIEDDIRNMQQKLKENYNIDFDKADEGDENDATDSIESYRVQDYDITTSASEIEKLRRKIRSLGDINHNAIQQYEESSTLYRDNLSQKEDLEKGAADLREGIDNLTREMKERFDVGFAEIRENFKKTFRELFGEGSSADLVLDYEECDDPLEAGIEIIAEPPGKRLQKISLLSGGEMALTAIAILFAILHYTPMPFCVLDEIEAPLDEANVVRFAKYLRTFSKTTQFIVITHKKQTMEYCDALYGVSMPDSTGVSVIFSVELAEAQKMAED